MTDQEELLNYSLKVQKKGFANYFLRNTLQTFTIVIFSTGVVNLIDMPFPEAFTSLFTAKYLGFLTIASLLIAYFMWMLNERTVKKLLNLEKK